MAGWRPGDLQGTLAGVPIMTFALTPPLSGFEVMVDGPDQGRPLQASVGAVIAAVAEAQAEVAPVPLGRDTLQALTVSQPIDHERIQ